MIAASCGNPPKDVCKKKIVLVSIPPYQKIAERLGANVIEVIAIAPPLSDPHTYEPTAKQVDLLSKASLWFTIGEPFENKLEKVLSAKKIDLRQNVDLLHFEGHHCSHCSHTEEDRHIWLSLKEMQTQATTIKNALVSLFPEKEALFEKQFLELSLELQAMDTKIKRDLIDVENRSFIVSHPAFAYFCRDYDFHQMSVEQEGKDPRPKEIENLLIQANELNPKIALTIPQHNNRGAFLIAQKLEIPVQSIDPYSPDYFETMSRLAKVLHESN